MQTIEIKGNVGDEVCLKFGDATLIVKLGKDEIAVDFVETFIKAVGPSPYMFLSSLNNQFHGTKGAIAKLEQTAAIYRDEYFAKIVPEEKEEAPEEEATPEKAPAKKKATAKKKEQD